MKKEPETTRRNYLTVLLVVLVLSGCASQPKNQIMLMPAPDVFDRGEWDPFTDRDPIKDIPYGEILFATDRKPSREAGQYYLNERGHVLRIGVARVTAGKEGMTWEEARRISLLKKRPEDFPLRVTDAREVDILDRSINVLTGDMVDKDRRQHLHERLVQRVSRRGTA